MYKEEKFQLRSVGEVKEDIDAIFGICNDLLEKSQEMGFGGKITQEIAYALVKEHPELNHHPGFAMAFHWLTSGSRTAFLQDADSLIMKTNHLTEILSYLRNAFPTLERVTTYARSKTLSHKSMDELKTIREAGLDRIHVGLESGDDTILGRIKKGATADIHIKGGRMAKDAGFQLSEYWMPGIGGRDLWESHAVNTAKVLSAIDPDYIRSRPLSVWPGTPLHHALKNREFEPQSGTEHLNELKVTIEHLEVTSRVCFDHSGNYWKNQGGGQLLSLDYEGYKLPEEKKELLTLIDDGLKYNRRQPGFIGM
jgi:hypothetical protein